ncbi:hypothetical protein [uncultured Thiothrix sp.]|uniref:hypothetical protein n=1 Tax=uncultured Thiothrix sp. TaxID=223185 RepID=UPI00262F2FEA|nr:hypothetical protein [uncultured Thiothrix sp.]
MMTRRYNKQVAYLGSLLLIVIFYSQVQAATDQWYYNQKLASPADSRAIFKSYHHPKLKQQRFAKHLVLKQWILKERNLPQALGQTPYLAPKSNQERALPFWHDLKPK